MCLILHSVDCFANLSINLCISKPLCVHNKNPWLLFVYLEEIFVVILSLSKTFETLEIQMMLHQYHQMLTSCALCSESMKSICLPCFAGAV